MQPASALPVELACAGVRPGFQDRRDREPHGRHLLYLQLRPTLLRSSPSAPWCIPKTVVGVIEAMKVFTEIPAYLSGTIVEILVKNGQPVEFGQPLFRVMPG